MKHAIALLALGLMLPLGAIAALSNRDAGYLRAEMQNQLGRYALATLAEKHASSVQLKQLARSMAAEATAHTRALDKIAKKNGIPVAAHPSVRSSYHYSQTRRAARNGVRSPLRAVARRGRSNCPEQRASRDV